MTRALGAAVLITRPAEDAERLAAPLRARGIAVRVEPLLTVVPLPVEIETGGLAGLLLTSANGVRALAAVMARRDLPAFCVGDQTARVAADLGFTDVRSAAGDIDSLAVLVIASLPPSAGPLLHAAASAVAGDLAGRLGAAGFTVHRAVLYETVPADALTPETAEALRSGVIGAIVLYSPRTAGTFATLAKKAELREACTGVTVYCLSPAVAAGLGDLGFHRVRIAEAPTQAALLALLDADQWESVTDDRSPRGS